MSSEILSALKEVYRRLQDLAYGFMQLANRVGAVEALAKQLGSQGLGGGGGNGNDLRVWLPTGIAGGSFGTPATKTDCIIAVRSGNGWTIAGGLTGKTIYNCDTTAVSGAKAGWATMRSDGTLELKIADC